ncbi:hypothetical protein FQZ97_781370 [compost metagenome]
MNTTRNRAFRLHRLAAAVALGVSAQAHAIDFSFSATPFSTAWKTTNPVTAASTEWLCAGSYRN